jgi:hypothetical protein
LVPQAGLEPALLSEQDFESSASTNSTTGARLVRFYADQAERSLNAEMMRCNAFAAIGARQGLQWRRPSRAAR